jgi:hypothetical protein
MNESVQKTISFSGVEMCLNLKVYKRTKVAFRLVLSRTLEHDKTPAKGFCFSYINFGIDKIIFLLNSKQSYMLPITIKLSK